MEKTRGSITVFFTLLLTTILTLICGALESARYSALSFLMETAQGSALESVFAGYYRPLWEEYHLLFMADGDDADGQAASGGVRHCHDCGYGGLCVCLSGQSGSE